MRSAGSPHESSGRAFGAPNGQLRDMRDESPRARPRISLRSSGLLLFPALIALAICAAAAPALAQSYPTKTIKLVVPFGPGGPTDVAARLVAQVVPAKLGQNMVIENRAGAGGATGSKSVATADPDGYTLLLGTSATLGVVPAVYKNPGYDSLKSFAPIAKIADSTTILVVPAQFPANTVQELIAYAKAHPGKLNYSSAGAGNQTQLVAELFKLKAGVDIVHVPYKSGAEMVTSILSDQAQVSFPDISILLPLILEKKIKALAVTGTQRHPALPDVPTMIESGIPDFVATFWTGVVAPAGTPPDAIQKLNGAINDGLRSPQVTDTLTKMGLQGDPKSPQEFAAFILAETRKWSAVAKIAGVTID
jgi:tripartite-type tricarboxylate transporter receptor subunit TctC